MRTIAFDLSPTSIQKAIRELRGYQKHIPEVLKSAEQSLAMSGRRYILDQMNYSNIGASMNVFHNDAYTSLYSNAWWAKYLEYGTGIVGKADPHPEPHKIGWIYDINEHGEEGWYYFQGGETHWTQGRGARPFLYTTARYLAEIAPSVVRAEFNMRR